MMKLKKLTLAEDRQFRELCEEDDLLNSLNINDFRGESVGFDIEVDESKVFADRFDLGKYLYEKLQNLPTVDERTWHFLVVIYHKQLLNKDGKVGALRRFYLEANESYQRLSGHLLKPVFDLFRAQSGEEVLIRFLLSYPVNEPYGGIFFEIAARPEVMKNKNLIQVSKMLFYDDENDRMKKGVKSQDAKYSTPFRRLSALFGQYARTYDLYSMPPEEILDKLISKHSEFEQFR